MRICMVGGGGCSSVADAGWGWLKAAATGLLGLYLRGGDLREAPALCVHMLHTMKSMHHSESFKTRGNYDALCNKHPWKVWILTMLGAAPAAFGALNGALQV
mmetsp:Transcript_16526/g.45305  ORF Transcript_16526/g.45305 Transcript_16526/m.45305 type:complete len:102 (+) Transcript_16526:2429-2734(+)